MVVDFPRHVPAAAFIPAIAVDFAEEVGAIPANQQLMITEQTGGDTDSVSNVVIGAHDRKAASAKGFNEAGSGGVSDDAFDFPVSNKPEQIVGIFLIGFLTACFFGIVVELPHPDPGLTELTPKAEGSGVDGTIIGGDSPGAEVLIWRRVDGIGNRVKEIVNQALGGAPLTEDEAPVEDAGIRALVTFSDFGG